jgi:hypothetical protein
MVPSRSKVLFPFGTYGSPKGQLYPDDNNGASSCLLELVVNVNRHLLECIADAVDEPGILLPHLVPFSALSLSMLHWLQTETLVPCLQWTCGQFIWFLP